MALITFDGFGSDTDITAVGYTRSVGTASSLVATSAGLLKFALSSNSLYTLDTSVEDHSFEIEWSSGAGGYDFFPLCARVTDISNMYCARISTPNNLQMYKYIAGVPTQLGTTVVLSGRASGDKMKIVCIGNNIQLWYAGTKRIDVTDTSHPSATKVGHFGRSTTSGGIINTAEWLDVTPVVSLDSINGGTNIVQIGSSGNTAETTGLTSATSASLNGVAMTSIAGSSSPWTFSCPPLTDGAVSPYPSGTFSITGAEGSPTLAGVAVTLPTGLTAQTLSGTLNTTNTGVLYNFSPAAVVTDQIFYPPVPTSGKYIIIDAQGNIDTDYEGTTQFWHWQASTGITRSYGVILGSGGLTSSGLTSSGLTRVGLTSAGL